MNKDQRQPQPRMSREQAVKIANEYRETLRQMKKLGIKVEDMPEDVARAALALHQHALLVEMGKHEET